MAAAAIDEEVIIHKRLITKETTVLPWQPSLNKVTAAFLVFSEAAKSASVGDCETAYNNFIRQLRLYEFEVSKVVSATEACSQELRQYEASDAETENRIQAMGAEISNLKRELARARRLRSQREQYELIAAEINKYPSTTDTQREIDAVQRELATLAADARATHEKLELRNKQFQLLLHSLADLQRTLDEEEEAGSEDEEGDSAVEEGEEELEEGQLRAAGGVRGRISALPDTKKRRRRGGKKGRGAGAGGQGADEESGRAEEAEEEGGVEEAADAAAEDGEEDDDERQRRRSRVRGADRDDDEGDGVGAEEEAVAAAVGNEEEEQQICEEAVDANADSAEFAALDAGAEAEVMDDHVMSPAADE